jgi:hypothetical protein
MCGCGGTGRRAALRSLWMNNPWKFESSQPHHFTPCVSLNLLIIKRYFNYGLMV